MRKLQLELEALQVESFETAPPGLGDPGTVFAASRDPLDPDPGTGDGGGGSGNIYCITAAPCIPSNEETCYWTCIVDRCGSDCNTCW